MNYVLGFLLQVDGSKIALIRKKRPAWQVGKLNGVGGAIDDFGEMTETSHDAMVRKFNQEAGVFIPKWELFGVLEIKKLESSISLFKKFQNGLVLKSDTDEIVDWYSTDIIYSNEVIPNLRWMIPVVLDGVQVHVEDSAGT